MQIVPKPGVNLYGAMVIKEIGLSRANKGTFFRSGDKERNRAKWSHKTYNGWITFERSAGETVTVEVQCLAEDGLWQIAQAFIGWVDRHFGKEVLAINIQNVE
jgi:hypothetical protein